MVPVHFGVGAVFYEISGFVQRSHFRTVLASVAFVATLFFIEQLHYPPADTVVCFGFFLRLAFRFDGFAVSRTGNGSLPCLAVCVNLLGHLFYNDFVLLVRDDFAAVFRDIVVAVIAAEGD